MVPVRTCWVSLVSLVLASLTASSCSKDADVGESEGRLGNVQDLWIFERITAVRPGREPVELGDAIATGLGDASDRQVELLQGVSTRRVTRGTRSTSSLGSSSTMVSRPSRSWRHLTPTRLPQWDLPTKRTSI
jgi:hypothetical protein